MANANTVATVPAHIAARIAARQAAGAGSSSILSSVLSGGDAFPYPRISIKAGRYRLIEDGVETPVGINLDVVIVGANPRVSKVFYAQAYDGSENVRPTCLSHDGLKPDVSISDPVAQSCATCPHNVLGSKITPAGAKSKLCADQRHLAVVPAADPTKPYAMTIPVSAMANLREYFKELQNFGVNPEEVVTELGFDDKVSYPKITFSRKGFAPAKALARLDALAASDEVKEVVRAIPLRSAGPALAAPAAAPVLAAPAPVASEFGGDDEDVISVPPAPAGKPSAAPVKASSELEAKLDSLFAE